MNVNGPRVFSTAMVLTCLLVGSAYPLAGAVQEGKKTKEEPAKAPQLVEAFMKGPVSISARVVRSQGTPEEAALPLFQVPVLKFEDKLELSFAGEAFDQRVTSADWSLVVVFLPKTVAPTDQGVVSFKLKHKVDRMVVPVISVPYDSVPMLFLIPDKNGRKKVLKDLNDHLESFRTLCAKIADLAAERATVDKFIEDLDAIDKNMSPVQYDSALLGFLHTYGSGVSVDVQAFAGGAHSNLDRCQFVTQEFQKTNILVPDPSAPAPATGATQAVAMTGGGGPVSAYVSIFFDVATIISNLWPGHQFQYLPALARNFHDSNADLYYTDWIHTTGDTLGALMCCPGKWEDQTAPSFDLELPKGESLLKKQVLLKARTKEHSRAPFSLFGHDWKLLVAGPKGESLPPLPLTISPSREAFVATPAPLLEPLAKLGATKVKARVVGRWGFTSIATEPLEVPAGCDPGWMPTSEETTAFQIGKDCSFTLSADWADTVDKVRFRSSAAGSVPMEAKLKDKEDGTRVATFEPKGEAAGKGMLEITTFGATKPALSRPMALLEALPEITAIEARQGDTTALLKGQHLSGIKALELQGRAFLPAAQEKGNGSTLIVKAVDGKPFDAGAGKQLAASLTLASGTREHLDPATLLPPRPRLGEALVIPMGVKGSGLMVTSTLPIAAAGSSSQVCLLAAKGYQFPSDGAFHVAIRNVEEPNEVRSIPSTKLRVMGHNQKLR